VPSGDESPRVPLLKKKKCFGGSALITKQARVEGDPHVRLPQVSACSRELWHRLKEDFPRIILGH
jgi:hypothetical protein